MLHLHLKYADACDTTEGHAAPDVGLREEPDVLGEPWGVIAGDVAPVNLRGLATPVADTRNCWTESLA